MVPRPDALQRLPAFPMLLYFVLASELVHLNVQLSLFRCDLRQPRAGVLSVCGGSDLFHSSFRFGSGLLAPVLGHELHTVASAVLEACML